MSIHKLLQRPIAYHKVYADLLGSVGAAVFLSQACYWQSRGSHDDGFFFKLMKEWQGETGLSRHEIESARKACKRFSFYSELRRGIPSQLYYSIDFDLLLEAIESMPRIDEKRCKIQTAKKWQSRVPESGNQEFRKVTDKGATFQQSASINTEITTENILTEITTDTHPLPPQGGIVRDHQAKDKISTYPVSTTHDALCVATTNNSSPYSKTTVISLAAHIEAIALSVVDYLNCVTGRAYRKPSAELKARLRGGASYDEACLVIDYKAAEWGHRQDFRQHINLVTLFRPSHWEHYLECAREWDRAGRPPIQGTRSGQQTDAEAAHILREFVATDSQMSRGEARL